MDFLGLCFYKYLFVVFQESVAELKKVAVAAVVEAESSRIWCTLLMSFLPRRLCLTMLIHRRVRKSVNR